jgi:hypothetical protein
MTALQKLWQVAGEMLEHDHDGMSLLDELFSCLRWEVLL